jgi:hypothetical protein
MSGLSRALSGYDAEFEQRLVDALVTAIADASTMTDGDGHPVIALRLGETANALTTVLASTLALSPSSVRSSRAIKQLTAAFRCKLQTRIRQAEADPLFADFKKRTFGTDAADRERGGNA